MSQRAWESRDGWVLTALGSFQAKDLSDIIGAFDALNHDILPCLELEGSLRRLGGAGLVKLGGRIRLTRKGRKLVRRAKGRGMIDVAESIASLLVEEPPPAALPAWEIDEGEYEAAYKGYVARMNRVT